MSRRIDVLSRDYLQREYVEKKQTPREIATTIGCCPRTVRDRLAQHGIELREHERRCNVTDLSGTTVGHWEILERITKDRRVHYRCRCTFEGCGKVCLVPGSRLRPNSVRRCTMCEDCRRALTARERFTGYGEISGRFWADAEERARRMNRPFNITIESMWKLFVGQNRRCALTGLPLSFKPTKSSTGEPTASIDRIDPTGGYVPGNVQWVHKDVNRIKGALTEKELDDWCGLIVAYQESNGPRRSR